MGAIVRGRLLLRILSGGDCSPGPAGGPLVAWECPAGSDVVAQPSLEINRFREARWGERTRWDW